MSNKLHTEAVIRKFNSGLYNLNRKIGIQAANFFKIDVFNAQGFIDRGVEKWKPSQKKKGKTLVKTGRGRRSIKPTRVSKKGVTIKAEAKYMKWHNTGAGKLPERQFMGDSATLDKKVMTEIHNFMKDL